jgi:hypothetical protein
VLAERTVAEAVDEELASTEDFEEGLVVVVEEVEAAVAMLALLKRSRRSSTKPSGPESDHRWPTETRCNGRWLRVRWKRGRQRE